MVENFDRFNLWVKKTLGIKLEEYKEEQIQRRIRSLMKVNQIATLSEYQELIRKDPEIKKAFIDHLTINVTEFYRNRVLFERLAEQLNRFANSPRLKIWSAACSIGSEPYTLAMICQKLGLTNVEILATDLDQVVLERARQGRYHPWEVKNCSQAELTTFFESIQNDYQVAENLRQMIDFKQHDLLADPYPTACQVIVCRNVTIYFKQEARDRVHRQLSRSLVLGGLLFVGATEVIYFPEQIGLKKIAAYIYQKIEE